ncbi:MAG: thioredoxin domain-containing protein [Oscillatoriaceae cyanobacterium Prado104]|jgi:thiol-disulfide isomerase/thioredoxin|nr:thioredoxin domain-containing protein [Oscillatoriaceae cyanobacterium Prado104]
MRKPALFLSLCLSSLMVTVSLVTATTLNTAAMPKSAIAQNPCASKPCASKQGNVGGPLAKQLQGKPVVVDIYASWCAGCKNIAPTISQLKQQYAGKVHFVVLDVTDRSTTSQAETTAKQLGLSQFLAANKSQTGSLTIIDPATGNILAQHRNNPNKSAYTTVLDRALAAK